MTKLDSVITKIVLVFLVASIFSCAAIGQNDPQKTWTFTYLKAEEKQKENLKAYIVKNWFVMDSIAVERGLFSSYKLWENAGGSDTPRDWDFIVAVEYFTRGTYSDIQEDWMTIRNEHTKVLIQGYDFPELGKVVKSEELIASSE